MSKRKSVTPTFKELLADLKPMTFWEKADHLWTYYKEWLLVVLLVFIVVAFSATALMNSYKKSLLSGMLINVSMTQAGYNYMTEDYHTYLGATPVWEVVQLDTTNFSSLEDPTSMEDNYNKSLMLMARVSGQMLDYALLDKMALEFYATQEVFLDLREFFTEDEIAAMGDRVIWMQPEPEEGYTVEDYEPGELEPWAMAVNVSDLPFFQDNCSGETVYFTMSGNHPNMEAVRAFLEYLMAWESPENA